MTHIITIIYYYHTTYQLSNYIVNKCNNYLIIKDKLTIDNTPTRKMKTQHLTHYYYYLLLYHLNEKEISIITRNQLSNYIHTTVTLWAMGPRS